MRPYDLFFSFLGLNGTQQTTNQLDYPDLLRKTFIVI
jgi:hypothetical protein